MVFPCKVRHTYRPFKNKVVREILGLRREKELENREGYIIRSYII
jgi:hypothetical protein